MLTEPFKMPKNVRNTLETTVISIRFAGSYQAGHVWEPGITRLLLNMLDLLRQANSSLLYLDLGANIGSHLLPVAARGFRTWALEPQPRNLAKERFLYPIFTGQDW